VVGGFAVQIPDVGTESKKIATDDTDIASFPFLAEKRKPMYNLQFS
jgi:hypothetical protein